MTMKPGRSKAKEVRDETNVRIKETDKYEEQRKAKKAEKLMRKSVGKRVQDNAETRQELANLVKEREEGKEI